MSAPQQAQTYGFQTEAKQLLHLMIHSLYSNKEIFLRELISNASDAADKLRFAALADSSLYENDPELRIWIDCDAEARTVTVTDNGIGMSRDEVIAHLGTIAKSGTAEFLRSLTGDQRKDSSLIGQFGVGFYSAFIVADRVEVFSRKAGLPAQQGVHWQSQGESEFSVAPVELPQRGTRVVLHLKEDEAEFSEHFRLRHIIKTYSDHIALPVMMRAEATGDAEEQPSETPDYEQVNVAKALWSRPRNEIDEAEYQKFYKHVAHDFENPLAWSHNRVEGKLEYTSLLYLPRRAPYDLWNRDRQRGLKLYVQRVFIMDDAEQFLPLYLRFIKGVIDSNDLSLNVSREILQKDPVIDSMRAALVKRVLDMLDKLAEEQPQEYQTFWEEFGTVLKEGLAEDHANRERIAALMRFASTQGDGARQVRSLKEYLAAMKPAQQQIYYLTAESFAAGSNSPHLEIFRKKGVEVLILSDRIDEWVMGHLHQFEGKQFQDVSRGDLDLTALEDEADKSAQQAQAKEYETLLERVKAQLAERVKAVRLTHRLTDSPACLASDEADLGGQMRRMMQAVGQKLPESTPYFELNPDHPLIARLKQQPEGERFADLVEILFDQARLANGEQLAEPGRYSARLNRLLSDLLG